MIEPGHRPRPGSGEAVPVPPRMTGPVLAGVVPDQPLDVVQRALAPVKDPLRGGEARP